MLLLFWRSGFHWLFHDEQTYAFTHTATSPNRDSALDESQGVD